MLIRSRIIIFPVVLLLLDHGLALRFDLLDIWFLMFDPIVMIEIKFDCIIQFHE